MKSKIYKLNIVLIIMLAHLLISTSAFAQSPDKLSYQVVVRNAGGVLVQSSNVGIKISILQGSAGGSPVYIETHTVATNANGLIALEIGAGTPVSGTIESINWSAGPYFLKSETDPTGGTTYTISGTSQLLSVPFALHAKTAAGYTETDPVWTAASSNYYTKTCTDAGFALISHSHDDATTTVSGFLSGADKTKLDALQNADGSETKVTSGTNVLVTGSGTTGSPYIINASYSGWTLTGNSGTVDGTNFIGTTDNVPLNFKVNNQKAGRIDMVYGNSFWGYQAGMFCNGGYSNTAIGYQAFYSGLGAANRNTAIGQNALYSNKTGSNGTAIGYNAMYYANNTSTPFTNYNVAVGFEALLGSTTASANIGNWNTALGYQTLWSNTTGGGNTANGLQALYGNSTGSNNTALGYQAGYTTTSANANISGSNNTFIGYNSGPGTSTQLTNATAIGYNALVSGNNSLVLGGTGANAVKVGIGVAAPEATLDVLGNVRIVDGTQGAGKVLTSDATGVATWQAAGGGGGGFTHYIGELYGGGIVVAVWKQTGIEHGLIASLADISSSSGWSNITGTLIGPTAQSPVDGQANTTAIITQSGHTSSAAKLCDDYTNAETGTGVYSDWYLPAAWEMNQCYNSAFIVNILLGATNGFQSAYYWSSTEGFNTLSWSQTLSNGVSNLDNKTGPFKVRAVRRF